MYIHTYISSINEINGWMSGNCMNLKMDSSVHSTGSQTAARQPFSGDVTCLAVVLDNAQQFSKHMKRLAGKYFYHQRPMRSERLSLSVDAEKQLVNAFITRRIDYCNSVFSRIAADHLHPQQSVLNAEVQLVIKRCKYDLITATIRDVLQWLPIQQRIEYKLYDCLQRCASHCSIVSYEVCVVVSIHQDLTHLRLAACGCLSVAANIVTTLALILGDLLYLVPRHGTLSLSICEQSRS